MLNLSRPYTIVMAVELRPRTKPKEGTVCDMLLDRFCRRNNIILPVNSGNGGRSVENGLVLQAMLREKALLQRLSIRSDLSPIERSYLLDLHNARSKSSERHAGTAIASAITAKIAKSFLCCASEK